MTSVCCCQNPSLGGGSPWSEPKDQVGHGRDLCSCHSPNRDSNSYSSNGHSNSYPSNGDSNSYSSNGDSTSYSSNSNDSQLMYQTYQLALKEQHLKHQIETLKQIEQTKTCKCPNTPQNGSYRLPYDKINQRLVEGNRRASEELKQVRLELKHCMDRVEGSLVEEVQKQRCKCEHLQHQMLSKSKTLTNRQQFYMRDMNKLQTELSCACTQLLDVNNTNKRLKQDICRMQSKYGELVEDLQNQKLSEARTMDTLNRALCMSQAMGDHRGIGEEREDESLEAIARRLSKTLLDVENCHRCKKIPLDLKETVKCVKELLDLMHKRGKRGRVSIQGKKQVSKPKRVSVETTSSELKITRSTTATIESKVDVSIQSEVISTKLSVETETEITIEETTSPEGSEKYGSVTGEERICGALLKAQMERIPSTAAAVEMSRKCGTFPIEEEEEGLEEEIALTLEAVEVERGGETETEIEISIEGKHSSIKELHVVSKEELSTRSSQITIKSSTVSKESSVREEEEEEGASAKGSEGLSAELGAESGEDLGITTTTTLTEEGVLEVVTESPLGIVETTVVYTESGNLDITTEITTFEGGKGEELSRASEIKVSISSSSRLKPLASMESSVTVEESDYTIHADLATSHEESSFVTEDLTLSAFPEEAEEVPGAEGDGTLEEKAGGALEEGGSLKVESEPEISEVAAEEASLQDLEGEVATEAAEGETETAISEEGEVSSEFQVTEPETELQIEVSTELQISELETEAEIAASIELQISEAETEFPTETEAEIQASSELQVPEAEAEVPTETEAGIPTELEGPEELEEPTVVEAPAEAEEMEETAAEEVAGTPAPETVEEPQIETILGPSTVEGPTEEPEAAKPEESPEETGPPEEEPVAELEIEVIQEPIESSMEESAMSVAIQIDLKKRVSFSQPSLELVRTETPVIAEVYEEEEEEEKAEGPPTEEELDERGLRHESICEEPYLVETSSDMDEIRRNVAEALSRANQLVLDALDSTNKDVLDALEKAKADMDSALALALRESVSVAHKQAFTEDEFLQPIAPSSSEELERKRSSLKRFSQISVPEKIVEEEEAEVEGEAAETEEEEALVGEEQQIEITVEISEAEPELKPVGEEEGPEREEEVSPEMEAEEIRGKEEEEGLEKGGGGGPEREEEEAPEKEEEESSGKGEEESQEKEDEEGLGKEEPEAEMKSGELEKEIEVAEEETPIKSEEVKGGEEVEEEEEEEGREIAVFGKDTETGTVYFGSMVSTEKPPDIERKPTPIPPLDMEQGTCKDVCGRLARQQGLSRSSLDLAAAKAAKEEAEPEPIAKTDSRISRTASVESRKSKRASRSSLKSSRSALEEEVPEKRVSIDEEAIAFEERPVEVLETVPEEAEEPRRVSEEPREEEQAIEAEVVAEEGKSSRRGSRGSRGKSDLEEGVCVPCDLKRIEESKKRRSSASLEGKRETSRKKIQTDLTGSQDRRASKSSRKSRSSRSKSKEFEAEGKREEKPLSAPAAPVSPQPKPPASSASEKSVQKRPPLPPGTKVECDCGECDCEICSPDKMGERETRLKKSKECTCRPFCGCPICTATKKQPEQSGDAGKSTLSSRLKRAFEERSSSILKTSREKFESLLSTKMRPIKEEPRGSRHPPDCDCLDCLCDPCGDPFPLESDSFASIRAHPLGCDCIACLCDTCTPPGPCEAAPRAPDGFLGRATENHPDGCDCLMCRCCECLRRKREEMSSASAGATTTTLTDLLSRSSAVTSSSASKKISVVNIPVSSSRTSSRPTTASSSGKRDRQSGKASGETPSSAEEAPPKEEPVGAGETRHPPHCDCFECLRPRLPKIERSEEMARLSREDLSSMETTSLELRLKQIERESQQRKLQLGEFQEMIKKIGCACKATEGGPGAEALMARRKSSVYLTMSGLKVALASLQKKCDEKDRMIAAMTTELSSRKGFADGSGAEMASAPAEEAETAPEAAEEAAKRTCGHPDYPNCPCVTGKGRRSHGHPSSKHVPHSHSAKSEKKPKVCSKHGEKRVPSSVSKDQRKTAPEEKKHKGHRHSHLPKGDVSLTKQRLDVDRNLVPDYSKKQTEPLESREHLTHGISCVCHKRSSPLKNRQNQADNKYSPTKVSQKTVPVTDLASFYQNLYKSEHVKKPCLKHDKDKKAKAEEKNMCKAVFKDTAQETKKVHKKSCHKHSKSKN